MPVITKQIVNLLIKNAYAPYHDHWGTLNEIFSNTDAQGRVLSAGIGIDAKHSTVVNELLLKLNETHGPFLGVYAYRFVKGTKATLGFTRFEHTCIAEFDSVEASHTHSFYNAIWNALDNAGIPYTFHWGKINNLDKVKVEAKYGDAAMEWMEARNQVLPTEMLPVFTNDALKEFGLDRVFGGIA